MPSTSPSECAGSTERTSVRRQRRARPSAHAEAQGVFPPPPFPPTSCRPVGDDRGRSAVLVSLERRVDAGDRVALRRKGRSVATLAPIADLAEPREDVFLDGGEF